MKGTCNFTFEPYNSAQKNNSGLIFFSQSNVILSYNTKTQKP